MNETNQKKIDWRGLFLELVVVFLGVTAGFLLTNWNSSKSDTQLEEKYLKGFLDDIDNDIQELSKNIESDSLWLAKAETFVQSYQKNEIIDSDTAVQMLTLMSALSRLDSRNATYIDIVNSGNLNLIKDFDLKSKIIDYYVYKEGAKFIDDFFYDYFNRFSLPIIINNFNIVSLSFIDSKTPNKADFINTFVNHVSLIYQRKEFNCKLLSKGIMLKEQLENNIVDK